MVFQQILITVGNALITVWNAIAPAMQTIAGFASAWGLFVLQERRKESFAAQAARQSLVAELKFLEVLLSIAVIKCAHHSNIIKRGVEEFRWCFQEGFARVQLQEFTPEQLKVLQSEATHSDEQIADMFRLGVLRLESQVPELPISIINAVASAPTSARLSPEEIKRLLDFKWQIQMLNTEAQKMTENFRLTFTVTDEDNHKTVMENQASAQRMYGRRAAIALDYLRAALSELQKSNRS